MKKIFQFSFENIRIILQKEPWLLTQFKHHSAMLLKISKNFVSDAFKFLIQEFTKKISLVQF